MFCRNTALSFCKHLPVSAKQFWPVYSGVPWQAQPKSLAVHFAWNNKKTHSRAGTETLQGFHFHPSFGDFCNGNKPFPSQQVAASVFLHVWICICLYFFFFLFVSIHISTERVSHESEDYHWSAKDYVPSYLSVISKNFLGYFKNQQKIWWLLHGTSNYNPLFSGQFHKHVVKQAAALNHWGAARYPIAECHVLAVQSWPVAT